MVKALTFAATAGAYFLGITLWTRYQRSSIEAVALRPAHEMAAELSGPDEWRVLNHHIRAEHAVEAGAAETTRLTVVGDERDILDPEE